MTLSSRQRPIQTRTIWGKTKYNYLYTGKEFIDSLGVNWYDHHARYYDAEIGRWFAIDPALQASSPYLAMGNNPMMMVDEDGMTWGIFKAIGNAWDWAWDKGNQFAKWAQQNGIPDASFGVGMNSGGQVNPLVNVNGQEVDLTGEAASINRGIAYAMSSFTSQRDLVKRKFPYVTVDPLIFNGAWTYDPNDWFSAHKTLEDVIYEEWYKRSSGRVEMTDSPIDYLLGAGIGKAFLNGGRKLVVKAAVKGGSRKASVNGLTSTYDGVRAASAYLQKKGVPRVYRKEILQSFDVETISLRTAGNRTYGIRFYGGAAEAKGRYLFPTFTNYTNRTGLALPNKWNNMTGLKQFKIRTNTTYIYGRAAPQGGIYTGGSYQMYIHNLKDLIP
ncbi:RHS repeat-associated core domain-containing protein [Marinifilum caeruleilacunae]|uniref:RHS repeat-associated core domain-containing protein n=1 Tax=Marinifilum caeruleilacunae TaxID=2499076 RepID=A0ABX1X2N6_9BACT|nr:RHS repeat-associated core domain-containing protein [Marinifilum caeruleilacunae]NOU62359.1 hypothetical protein [Marinifilum caeruleilacunae]